MAVTIVGLGTALPAYAYPQRDVEALMRRWIGGERRVDRMLARVYTHSGIEVRHSVLPEFVSGAAAGLFGDVAGGTFARPSTGARNERYADEAPSLLERAARRALEAAPEALRDRVTHVVTVSCTGFMAPGVDDHLVRSLGLPASTERYHVGFMGCYAAFPALRMARAFCLADPSAVVLVAAVELCTLHLDPDHDVDSILSTSVFADGAAAALVTAADVGPGEHPGLELLASTTTLTTQGRQDMAWTIGDHGFDMVLTSYVPRALEAEAGAAVAPLLRAGAVSLDDVDAWAIHPGGRAILDKVALGLALPDAALAASRSVLAQAGNMSSATVLFVLERLLGRSCPDAACDVGAPERAGDGDVVAALAFGPGLTVDAALLRVTSG